MLAGLVIDDKYELEYPIGTGGMGQVWVAKRLKLGDKVAIKILIQSIRYGDQLKALEKEARATSLIRHPNVCKVFEFFEYQKNYFLVMEFLEGLDLSQFLKSRGDLSPLQRYQLALFISKHVLRALVSAHEINESGTHRILHRDIKPSNIFFTIHGEVKLLDLGIAKIESEQNGTKTTQYGVTLEYSSPDLWENNVYKGDRYSTQHDLYSLGIVFLEITKSKTDQLNFSSEAFKGILSRWLSINTEDRFSSARELLKFVEDEVNSQNAHEATILKFVNTKNFTSLVSPPTEREGSNVQLIKSKKEKNNKKNPAYFIFSRPLALFAIVIIMGVYFLAPPLNKNQSIVTYKNQNDKIILSDVHNLLTLTKDDLKTTQRANYFFMDKHELLIPGLKLRIVTGEKSHSVLSPGVLDCHKNDEGTVCTKSFEFTFSGNNGFFLITTFEEESGEIVSHSIRVEGEEVAQRFKSNTIQQLENKNFEQYDETLFLKNNESVVAKCETKNICAIITNLDLGSDSNDKFKKKLKDSNFTFNFSHKEIREITFGLKNQFAEKIKNNLKCNKSKEGSVCISGNLLVTESQLKDDYLVAAFFIKNKLDKISYTTKDKKKIDELVTKISRDKNFLNVVNTEDIKAWKSASEEFQAIKVDNHFLVVLKPVE